MNKQTHEWWQKLPANKFRKILKGVGRNKDGPQQVKSSDAINFIQRIYVPIG